MISASNVSVYIAISPVDMRKSINGLSSMVSGELKMDPLSSNLFVFSNRSRKIIKILYWHYNGFCIWQKRLERGKFKWPENREEVIVEISNETSVLKEQIALLKQMLFGRKSEKHHPDAGPSQLEFSFGEESENHRHVENQQPEPEVEIVAHKRRKRGRKLLSDSLPREERIIDIAEEDKLCECGSQKVVIGRETSEQLEYIPAKCKVIVNIRPKHACRNCEGSESDKPAVMIAPPPAQIIPKSFATASLLRIL